MPKKIFISEKFETILKGQKLVENTKIETFKWDILGNFETTCVAMVSECKRPLYLWMKSWIFPILDFEPETLKLEGKKKPLWIWSFESQKNSADKPTSKEFLLLAEFLKLLCKLIQEARCHMIDQA